MGPRKVIDFQFGQLFLIKMEVRTSSSLHIGALGWPQRTVGCSKTIKNHQHQNLDHSQAIQFRIEETVSVMHVTLSVTKHKYITNTYKLLGESVQNYNM